MSIDSEFLNKAPFTYLVCSERRDDLFANVLPVCNGSLLLQYTDATVCYTAMNEGRDVTIIGICVDSKGEYKREEIASVIANNHSKSIDDLIAFENRLAGRYVILLNDGKNFYAISDATGELSVYYYDGDNICLSSCDNLISIIRGVKADEKLVKIRNGQNYLQAMPGDITCYPNVKILLAGQHLCVNTNETKRFFYAETQANEDILRQGLEVSMHQIDNILNEYAKYYDLVCPLTGGWDSRLNLSFMLYNLGKAEAYTFYHKGFTDDISEIAIPKQICRDIGMPYQTIPDMKCPKDRRAKIESIVGPYYSSYTMDLATTYLSRFEGRALINGDIAGQIAKTSIGNCLSTRHATNAYFRCKLHNIEPSARPYINKYVDGIRHSDMKDQIYDVFGIENRLGRWAGQRMMIYAVNGITELNIYNCRSILTFWVSIPRDLRVHHFIHPYYFKRNRPDFMNYDFNKSTKIFILKKRPTSFLLATYAKGVIEKVKGVKH